MAEKKVDKMSPERKAEYYDFIWESKAKKIGDPRIADTYACYERELKNHPDLQVPDIWTDRGFEK